MRTLTFDIPGLPRMSNSLLRGHWRSKHAHALTWKQNVSRAILGRWRGEPAERVKLTLTRFSSVEPDYDGLVSSFKSVVDGLVEYGVLKNDKRSNITRAEYNWEKCKPRGGFIRVTVEEVECEEHG